MNRVIGKVVFAAVLAGASTSAAQGATVFYDDFNTIVASTLNTPPSGWTVSGGTVDSIFNTNVWGISCFGGAGGCVDLDGSTRNAGLLSQGTFTLFAGVQYTLSAQISGNQRGGSADNVTFGFLDSSTNAVVASSTISSLAPGAPFALRSLVFTGAADRSVKIFFEDTGADNVGAILDNVSLTAVPLPAAAWLLLSGLAGLGVFGRRRKTA